MYSIKRTERAFRVELDKFIDAAAKMYSRIKGFPVYVALVGSVKSEGLDRRSHHQVARDH